MLAALTLVLVGLAVAVIPGVPETARWVIGVSCLVAAVLIIVLAPKKAKAPVPKPAPPSGRPLLIQADNVGDIQMDNIRVIGDADLLKADNVKTISATNIQQEPFVPPTSKNAPCPCGSGRKFKNCHGKKK